MKISIIAALAPAAMALALLVTPASAGSYYGNYYDDEYNYGGYGSLSYGCGCCTCEVYCDHRGHRYRGYEDTGYGYSRRHRSYDSDDGYRQHHHRQHRRHHARDDWDGDGNYYDGWR